MTAKARGLAARGHRTKPRQPRNQTVSAPIRGTNRYAPRVLGPEGRLAWRQALLSAPWLDRGADELLLRRFCELHDDAAVLKAQIAASGWVAVGSQGQAVESPAVRMLASVDDRIAKLAGLLGLGPAARKRVSGRLEVERERPALAAVVDLYASAVGEAS